MEYQKTFQVLGLVKICVVYHCNNVLTESRWCATRLTNECVIV